MAKVMTGQIDPSHEMGDWESSIVTILSTSRFGEVRACKHCDAEHAKSVSGEAIDPALTMRCRCALEE